MRRSVAGWILLVLLVGGCGGGGDPLPAAAGPEAPGDSGTGSPTPTPQATPTPTPGPAASAARLWIEGVRVEEPYTLEVTREADASGEPVRHRLLLEIPSRGWDVRLSIPTAPFDWQSIDGDGTVTTGRSEPEREQWSWCSGTVCAESSRITIERLVLDGVTYGVGAATRGANDPCANGTWRHGDPPSEANRQGAVRGVTERLFPEADGSLNLWGLDDQCTANAPIPGVRVDFWVAVE